MTYAAQASCLALLYPHDIIHAHDWLTIPAACEAKKYSGKPLILDIHATEFDRSGDNKNELIYNIEKYGIENADKIIAVSHYTKSILISKYHADPKKIEVVHNGVSKKLTSPIDKEYKKLLLFPTKQHWKMDGDIVSIEKGLQWLVDNYKKCGILIHKGKIVADNIDI